MRPNGLIEQSRPPVAAAEQNNNVQIFNGMGAVFIVWPYMDPCKNATDPQIKEAPAVPPSPLLLIQWLREGYSGRRLGVLQINGREDQLSTRVHPSIGVS